MVSSLHFITGNMLKFERSDQVCQNLLLTIAMLFIAFSLLLSFFPDAQLPVYYALHFS